MPLTTFTVPAAGKHKKVQAIGLTVYVVKAPGYVDALAAPRLSFDNPGGQYPMLLGSIIGSDQGSFSNLVVTGTPESAGDEITLLGIPVCLETNINLPDTGVGKATPGNTLSIDSTDAAQDLSALQLIDSEGNLLRSIYVSVSGNPIRYAFNDGTGTDPDQAGFGHLLAVDDNPQEIQGYPFIQDFKFASAAAGTPGTLIITREF